MNSASHLLVVLGVLLGPIAGDAPAVGDRPADGLLRLVPPDAGLTLVVEDLRDHARSFLASPLAASLRELPAVRDWLNSDDFRKLQVSRRELEAGLKTDLATIRDEILGDAVVLAMHLPEGASPEAARGLMLARHRDRDLAAKLVDALNRAQQAEIARLVPTTWKGVTYQRRAFRPNTKPDEWYALLDGNVFAWSNSEALIRGVIDRQAGGDSAQGLAGVPAFRRLREAQPARPVASLFADPRFLERILGNAPGPRREDEERVNRLLLSYLKAVDYAALTAESRDGLVLHLRQEIAADRLDAGLRHWAASPGSTGPLLGRVPASTIALAAGNFDFAPVFDILSALVPAGDRPRLDLLAEITRGAWPDKDFRSEILPQLGPGLLVFAERPVASAAMPPWVAVLGLSGPEGRGDAALAKSIGGILRAALALVALQTPAGNAPGRIETRTIGGVTITGLQGGGRSLAFAVEADRVVLGHSPEGIARYLGGSAAGGPEFQRRRAARFPDAESFVYVDAAGLRDLLTKRRPAIVGQLDGQRGAGAARDFDQVLALLGLFRYGYATAEIGPGFAYTHHALGLVTVDPDRRD